jgi:hypothetical protein
MHQVSNRDLRTDHLGRRHQNKHVKSNFNRAILAACFPYFSRSPLPLRSSLDSTINGLMSSGTSSMAREFCVPVFDNVWDIWQLLSIAYPATSPMPCTIDRSYAGTNWVSFRPDAERNEEPIAFPTRLVSYEFFCGWLVAVLLSLGAPQIIPSLIKAHRTHPKFARPRCESNRNKRDGTRR